jgi:hypothetical protein
VTIVICVCVTVGSLSYAITVSPTKWDVCICVGALAGVAAAVLDRLSPKPKGN